MRETLDALARAGMPGRVVARQRGSLGPLLRARADWLRERGLLYEGDREDMLVIRAERTRVRHPSGAAPGSVARPRIPA